MRRPGVEPANCEVQRLNNNNNNNNTQDDIYSAVITTHYKVIARVHSVHLMNVEQCTGYSKGNLKLHTSPLPSLPSLLYPPLPFFTSPAFPSLFPFSSLPTSHLPLDVGPLSPARGLGSAVSSPSGVWGKAPAAIDFGAF